MNKLTKKVPQITHGTLTVTVKASTRVDYTEKTVFFIHEILFQHDKDCRLHTFGIRCNNDDHRLDNLQPEDSVYMVLTAIKDELQNYTYNGDFDELIRRVDSRFWIDGFGCYYASK